MQQEQAPAVFQGLRIFFFLCSNSDLNTRQPLCLKLLMERVSSPSSSDAFWAFDTNDNVLGQLCAVLVQCIMFSLATSKALDISFSEVFCIFLFPVLLRLNLNDDRQQTPLYSWWSLQKKNSIKKNNRGERETLSLRISYTPMLLAGSYILARN